MANRPAGLRFRELLFIRRPKRPNWLGPSECDELRFKTQLPWALSFSFARDHSTAALRLVRPGGIRKSGTGSAAASRPLQPGPAPWRIHCRMEKAYKHDNTGHRSV